MLAEHDTENKDGEKKNLQVVSVAQSVESCRIMTLLLLLLLVTPFLGEIKVTRSNCFVSSLVI